MSLTRDVAIVLLIFLLTACNSANDCGLDSELLEHIKYCDSYEIQEIERSDSKDIQHEKLSENTYYQSQCEWFDKWHKK